MAAAGASGSARTRRLVALSALLVLLLVLGWAAYLARSAAEDLSDARERLTGLLEQDPDPDQARRDVDQALALVTSAERSLASPAVSVAAALPVLGRSWSSGRAVVDATLPVLRGAKLVADRAEDVATPGGVDVDVIDELGVELRLVSADARAAFDQLEEQRTAFTPSSVQEGVADAREALRPAVDGLERGAEGADLAARLLGAEGPRDLLVALQNNAELRGTGGYVSTFSTGRLEDGSITLAPFADVVSVNDTPEQARPVPAPPEFSNDYGEFLADTTLWRNWTMSPDIPASASVGAEAAGVLLGTRPEVVVLLDVPALAALVQLRGEELVLPDGTALSGDGLTEALLVDTYAAAGVDFAAQDVRRAQLRATAGQAATALLGGDVDLLGALQELGRLAAGRHLAVWSADPEEQAALERLGFAGELDPRGGDLVSPATNNLNATKLDFYVERSVEVEAVLHPDRVEVVQRLTLTNQAPDGLVPYVAGEDGSGRLRMRVEMSAALGAGDVVLEQDGQPALGGIGRGPERTRVHSFVELSRGQSVTYELRYAAPYVDGTYRVRLVPQPLATDADLSVRLRSSDEQPLTGDTGGYTGPWEKVEELVVSRAPAA